MGRQRQNNLVLTKKANVFSSPVRKIIEEASREKCDDSTTASCDREAHDYWNDEPRHEHHRDQG